MQQGKFVYDIKVEITLSGAELSLLTDSARAHYDYGCKTYFTTSAQRPAGARWREDFTLRHGASPEDAQEKTVTIQVSSSELDRCKKILGMAPYLGVSPRLYLQLDMGLAQAFQTIQQESRRLTPIDLDGESVPAS